MCELSIDKPRARSANHAACDECGQRINGYVAVDLGIHHYACADCIALGMGVDLTETERYIARTSTMFIDRYAENDRDIGLIK